MMLVSQIDKAIYAYAEVQEYYARVMKKVADNSILRKSWEHRV